MEIQASRSAARTGPAGEPILLLDQDRARWDRLLIRRGLAALDARPRRWAAAPGPVHAAGRDRRLPRAGARRRGHRLGRGSPRSTRALAAAHAVAGRRAQPGGRGRHGRRPGGRAGAGRRAARPSRRLQGYHLLPSVRGDLLARLGRTAEARAEFERAAALTRNAARAARCCCARAAALGSTPEA